MSQSVFRESRVICSRRSALNQAALFLALSLVTSCATGPNPLSPPGNMTRETIGNFRATQEKPVGPMTAEMVVELALNHNPEILDLKELIRVAEADRSSVLADNLSDPQIRLSYGQGQGFEDHYKTIPLTNAPWIYIPKGTVTNMPGSATSLTKVDGSGNNYQATFQLPIPNPWLISRMKDSATIRIEAAKADLKAKQWQVEMDARRAVEDILYLQQDIAAIDKLIKLQNTTVEMMEVRVKQGTATIVGSITATTKHLAAINERVKAIQNYQQSLRSIAALMGLESSDLAIITTASALPDLVPQAVDCSFLGAIACQNRPDVAAFLWKVRSADADLREARVASIPWFASIQGQYAKSTYTQITQPLIHWTATDGTLADLPSIDYEYEDDGGSSWRIDASITIPLFSSTIDRTKRQRAECMRARTALSSALQRLLIDIRDTVRNLQSTYDNLKNYSVSSTNDLALLKSIQQRARQQGVITPDEDARIEAEFIQHDRGKCQLEYEYRKALLDLKKVAGRDMGFIWGSSLNAKPPVNGGPAASTPSSPPSPPPAQVAPAAVAVPIPQVEQKVQESLPAEPPQVPAEAPVEIPAQAPDATQ